MRLLLISEAAREDLREVWENVALDDEDRADRLIDNIVEAARRLLEWPQMGRARPDLLPDIRCLVVGRYLVFYRIRPSAIQLVRVLHGRRDIDALF